MSRIELGDDRICRRFTLVCRGEGPNCATAQVSALALGSARAAILAFMRSTQKIEESSQVVYRKSEYGTWGIR